MGIDPLHTSKFFNRRKIAKMAQHPLHGQKLKKTIGEVESAHQGLERLERRLERIEKHLGIDSDTEDTD